MIQSKEGLLNKPSQLKGPIDFDDEPSGPYIPISECYTGKPVSFKGYPNSNHHLPPPLLPSSSSSVVHHQIPPPPLPHPHQTPHHHGLGYKQLPNSPGVHHHHHQHQMTSKPEESANYDIPRSSVFTKVALPTSKSSINGSSTSSNSTPPTALARLHFANKSATLRPTSKSKPCTNLIIGPSSQTMNRNALHLDHSRNRASIRSCGPTMDSSTTSTTTGKHSPIGYANDDSSTPNDFSYYNFKTTNGSRILEPPPRPPKPTKLNNRSKSESCSSLLGSNYLGANDHSPSTPLDSHLETITSSPFNPTITANIINNSASNINSNNNNNNILNNSTSQSLTLDDVYDFPKSEPVFTSLRTPIPAPGNRATKGNSHSYTNAPPGHLNKPPVFTYDYKGNLPNCLDDNHITFDSETCDRSPLTPNSAFDSLSSNGSLSKSLTPPAVNRDLKPRRKGSDSDANSSPTSPTFTLSPPPAHSKSHHQSTVKPTRHLNDTPPRVPSRGRQFQFHHSRDASNSDEDIISHSSNFHKRNSSTDDQSRRAFTIPRKSPSESPNVTYLDLDLQESSDKDSSRPRSANSSDPYKASLSHSKDLNGTSNLSGSQSTVYKSIDFVATDAFRQLRISSQRLIERE